MLHCILRGSVVRLASAALLCVALFVMAPNAHASCCKGTTCTDDNLIVCAISGGNWLPGPCIPLVTCAISGESGACCNPLLPCIDSPENLCFGQFMGGLSCGDVGSCRDLPPPGACCGLLNQCSNTIEDGCTGLGETFIEGDSCDEATCGILGASGACCTALGGCMEVPSSGASVTCLGGTFHTGKTCEEMNQCAPVEVMGACCDNGACHDTSASSCDANGGVFAPNAVCEPDLCAIDEPEGVCCVGDGRCVDARADDCLAGAFHEGASCSQDADLCEEIAPPAEGACCVQGRCEIESHATCNARGGNYNGDDTLCEDDLCAPPPAEGACCTENGCSQTTEDACTSGAWNEGQSCGAPGVCAPPDVACCDASFECTMMDEARCENSGGSVVGEVCAEGICGTPPGACCVDEAVTDDDAATCKGTFVDDVTPEDVDCSGRGILGGCCLGNGVCEETTRNACEFEGGSWSNNPCDPSGTCQEPQPRGACCEEDGCRSVRADACDDGAFHAGEECSRELCGFSTPVGACCTGSSCSVTTEEACLEEHRGVFSPDASCDALEDVCPGAVRGACCADAQCTEQARATCERHGGQFHADQRCDDAALCAAPTPEEPVEEVPPVDGADPDVSLTGGRLFSCASGPAASRDGVGWLLTLMALGMLRRRKRPTTTEKTA